MMFWKLSKKCAPKRILVVSMTNIGDVVLTCPAIDILREGFPQATMDIVVGPKAVSLFKENPHFGLKVFNKQGSLKEKKAFFLELTRGGYDCVVDFRKTALSFFLFPRFATPVITLRQDSELRHKKGIHLNRLRQVYDFDAISGERYAVLPTKEDERFFEVELSPFLKGKNFVVIAPGAASSDKRWSPAGFAAVADHLSAALKVVFVGDSGDVDIVAGIQSRMKAVSFSLAGKTDLRQLAFILQRCSWAITHDSGVMHLASYFNVPLVALWGPTSLEKYAPWTSKFVVVRRNEECPRCQSPKSILAHNCMSFIKVDDVIKSVVELQKCI